MNKINRHNYEAFLLDYSEGVLPAEEVAELLLFMEKNKDLTVDLTEFDLPYLDASNESFDQKDALKSIPRMEELVIGHTENILNDEETLELASLEKSFTGVKALKNAYKSTVLPIENITYPNKNELKRTRVIPMYWLGAAVAAVFVGMMFMFNFDSSDNGSYASGTLITPIDKFEVPKTPLMDELANNTTDSVGIKVESPILPKDDNFAQASVPQDEVSNDTVAKEMLDVVPEKFDDMHQNIADIVKDTLIPTHIDDVLNNENELAVSVNPKSDPLTIKEFLQIKTKEIVLKENEVSEGPINGNELLASLAEGLNEKTKIAVAYQNEESDNKKVTRFKLGKFEYYKSSSK